MKGLNPLFLLTIGEDFNVAMRNAVKSNELEWLPNGSEFPLVVEGSNPGSSKPKTYTSFSCSQDSLLEFSNNPIGVMKDIIISKLGPDQVTLLFLCIGC